MEDELLLLLEFVSNEGVNGVFSFSVAQETSGFVTVILNMPAFKLLP
jgi:hypothetical protein